MSASTTSMPRAFAAPIASNITAAGSPPCLRDHRDAVALAPDRELLARRRAERVAGREQHRQCPCDWKIFASLPIEVVLPAPLTPASMMTNGRACDNDERLLEGSEKLDQRRLQHRLRIALRRRRARQRTRRSSISVSVAADAARPTSRSAVSIASSVSSSSVPARRSASAIAPRQLLARAREARLEPLAPTALVRAAASSRLKRSNIRDEGGEWNPAATRRPRRKRRERNAIILPACRGAPPPRRASRSRSSPCPSLTRTAFASSAAPCAAASCAFPRAAGLRPTPDRVRETLFNWLGQDLTGTRCLDLYAGTGALSLEARRAARRLRSPSTATPSLIDALRANGAQIRSDRRSKRTSRDARAFCRRGTRAFDVDLPRSAVPRRSMAVAAARRARSGSRRADSSTPKPAHALAPPPALRRGAATRRGRCIIIFSSVRTRRDAWHGLPSPRRSRGPRREPSQPCSRSSTPARSTRSRAATRTSCAARRSLFDRVVVGVADSEAKRPFFTTGGARRHGARGAARPTPTSRSPRSRRC